MPRIPEPNLPIPAAPWGRWVTGKLQDMERQNDRGAVAQDATDDGLTATVGGLTRAIADVRAAQAAVANVVSSLAEQVAFLQSQTVGQAKGTQIATSRSTTGSITLESFNSDYDNSLSVTTGASGVLLISVGGLVGPSSGATAGIGLEIVGQVSPGNGNSVLANGGSFSLAATRTVVVSLSGNTTYTVRTRRWYSGTSPNCLWGYATLTVTKLA